MHKLIVQDADILPYSNNLTWNNDSDTLGTQLNFESIKEIPTGTVVSLWNDSLEIFRGMTLKPTQKRWTYSYVCQDYSFYLKNKVTKQFDNMAASDAIKSLLSEAYIIPDIIYIPTKITKIYKEKTLSEIIEDILTLATADQGITYFKEIEGNILYIKKLEDMIITPNILLPKDITISQSMENMKNKIEIVINGESNTSIVATAEDTSVQGFYGVLADQQSVDDKDIAQAQNMADNALKESNRIQYSTSLEVVAVDGGDSIKANRMIYLQAGIRLNGYYKIKSANHTLTKGKHKVSIILEW